MSENLNGGVIEGIGVGIDGREVEGAGCGQGVVMKEGEIVVEMEVDDQVKVGTEGGVEEVGGESEVVNVGDGAGVGGNYDEGVQETEVDRVENDGDRMFGGNYDEGVPKMEVDRVETDGDRVIRGSFDEVVPEVEVDRAENDGDRVAVGIVNEVLGVEDEMCSGGISVGRNEYDSIAFEHFNNEGLNLVVDLGDLFGSEKELRPRDVPNEELNSDGISLTANSNKQCLDVNMEGVNLGMDLYSADKEYKDERLAFQKDGSHVTVCGALGDHLYGNDNVFEEPLNVTGVPLLDGRVNGTDGNNKSDPKEIPIEARIGNYAVSGHRDLGVNNNLNAVFEEQITGVTSDDKDGYKSNLVALRPKVRSEHDQTEKDGEYYLSDLVWGKVRGHPWWPGQIFEPSAASTKAEKHFKKDSYLVAYFGDRTFSWNEPESLKPFHSHYVRMAKQSKFEDFCEAVDCALEEVSRRVEYALSCSCLPTDQLAKMENRTCISAGIRQESIRRYGIGKGASSFAPTELLQNIQLLAADPFHEIDKLRFVNVRAQLLAYNHWKGFNNLPDIVELNGLRDGDADIQTLGKKSSVHMHDKGEGRTRRSIQDVSSLKYKHVSDCVSDDSSIMVDNETEMVRRTGRKKGSLSSGKKIKEKTSRVGRNARSGKNNVGNNSIDAGNMPLPEEILPKLCLAAASPMEGYGFMKPFISFLSHYRNTICLEHKNGGKRKRGSVEQIGEKPLQPEAVEMYEFEGTEDLYWTDRIILHNPEEQEFLEPDNQLGIMIPDIAGEVELGAENSAEVGENSEEYTPTELILKFSDLESVPSITELNKIFSRYGPLYESQTVVFSKSKRAKVVFKIRSHAETAFSSSGKFSIFGHSLLGYCLKASTSSARNKKVAKSANAK
ncbi:hypothetical protein Leryth_009894 [Lithospermum erythrorhizon]|nr:hypothetical protein Leryth_009894 [Lithospermum erythrorhizon]